MSNIYARKYRWSGIPTAEAAALREFIERPRFDATGGSCVGKDPGTFIQEYASNSVDGIIKNNLEAITICRGCPIRLCCLQWALDQNEPVGIWGGICHAERSHARGQNTSAEELIQRDLVREMNPDLDSRP